MGGQAMRNRTLLRMALLPVCVLGLCAGAWAAERAGMVVGLQGQVEATGADGQRRVLSMGAEVFSGDTLITPQGARLQVMLEDDTLIGLSENSSLTIDEYVFDPRRKENNGLAVRIGRGIARIITGIITDLNPERFKVRTSRATIGIRGCELGFRCGEDVHRYFVVRVPERRFIQVTSELTDEMLVFSEPGFVDVDERGRLRRGILQEREVRDILDQTTPQFEPGSAKQAPASSRGAKGGGEGEEPVKAAEGAVDEESVRSEPLPLDTADQIASVTPSIGETASDTQQSSQDVRMETSITEDRGDQFVSPPPPPPPPPPAPGYPSVMGAGETARYHDWASWSHMDGLLRFRRAEGFIGDGRTSVDFYGDYIDVAGRVLAAVKLSLRDVSLIRFGSDRYYEGWRQISLEPGVRLANDNLQQFVRHIDLRGSAPQILYWGIPAGRFSETPPPDRVLAYDIAYAEFHRSVPLPRDIPGELLEGSLRFNTKTGGYAILLPGLFPIYGRGAELQFFGQSWQGVGGVANFNDDSPVISSVYAGFRSSSGEHPAETGVSVWRGYGAAMAWNDARTPAVRELHSADMSADNPAVNEGRVQLTLNRDDPLHAVSASMTVHENPATPTPTDLAIANVQDSLFVEGNLYAGRSHVDTTDSSLMGVSGGKNWSWGIWDSETSIDMGGGATETEYARGHYVVGETLSPAAFQALVAGAQSYLLRTPAGQPGHVSATLTGLPNYRQFLEGEANLTVHIPGGGAPATWHGRFTGGKPGEDSFDIQYATPRPISANGHLRGGVPDSYALHAHGMTYDGGTLTDAQMTGNLVGPGVGPRPITGAIGEGRFAHSDGTVLNLTYGTDLSP